MFSEDVYNQYRNQIKNTVLKLTANENICDDIVQECITKVIENEDKLRTLNSSQLRAYILRTTESIARRYSKNQFIFLADCAENTYEIESKEDNKIDFEIIKNSFDKLSQKDRTIIQMKYILSMSDREIAPVLNIKENCVRMTLKRSISKLRKIMNLQV